MSPTLQELTLRLAILTQALKIECDLLNLRRGRVACFKSPSSGANIYHTCRWHGKPACGAVTISVCSEHAVGKRSSSSLSPEAAAR